MTQWKCPKITKKGHVIAENSADAMKIMGCNLCSYHGDIEFPYCEGPSSVHSGGKARYIAFLSNDRGDSNTLTVTASSNAPSEEIMKRIKYMLQLRQHDISDDLFNGGPWRVIHFERENTNVLQK